MKTVDHVETHSDEASQSEAIVSGQFKVEFKVLFGSKTYLLRQAAFIDVKAYVDKLMKEDNLGYCSALGKLGEKKL